MSQSRQPHDYIRQAQAASKEEDEQLPSALYRNTQQRIDEEQPPQDQLMHWALSFGMWVLFIVQGLVAFAPIKDMWNGNYNGYAHFFMTLSFGLSLAACAFIYKYLRGK